VPRRLLTHPGTPTLNGGHDNSESNLVVRVHDEIVPEKSHSAKPVKYVVVDQLGQGTFGQVFLCGQVETAATGAGGVGASAGAGGGSGSGSEIDGGGGGGGSGGGGGGSSSGGGSGGGERMVAVKVVKNKPAYTSQAWVEVRIARLLNDEHGEVADPRSALTGSASLASRPVCKDARVESSKHLKRAQTKRITM